ncbi:uncharacterized protein NEMAJ01_1946 [Nematocida major]|uniref:uncharacterized protein n=1 Tax=Nematocida major TaxID=1912982 RepID=UPI0020087A0C|nr:uncharacterized protein NEMAJ01_1946 [Nematocida major]KAH9387050.1 hypothetical protein NEMAJ01_1946 [Nematocida major]
MFLSGYIKLHAFLWLLFHSSRAGATLDAARVDGSPAVCIEKLIVCPWSPLGTLQDEICAQLNFISCLRSMSLHIKTEYLYSISSDKTLEKDSACTRTGDADQVYPREVTACAEAEGSEHDSYIREYYTVLILLFPLVDYFGNPIESAHRSLFTQFLQEECQVEQKCYILASLFLLSEGVHTPVEVSEKRLVLWQDWSRKAAALEISLIGMEVRKKAEIFRIVNFFKEYTKMCEMPTTKEEFETGCFLESPQFLIRAYRHHCIADKEEMAVFFKCVHRLLEDLCSASLCKSRPCKEKQLLGEWFLPEERQEEGEKYLEPFLTVQKAVDNAGWFSYKYANNKLLNMWAVLQKQAPRKRKESRPVFISAENALLMLLCCLSYDPMAERYCMEKNLEKFAKDRNMATLYDFLANAKKILNSSKRIATTDHAVLNFFNQWCSLVWYLPTQKVSYCCPSRVQLGLGILNFFYALECLTGNLFAESRALDTLAEKARMAGPLSESLRSELEAYISQLFTALSINKSLKVTLNPVWKEMSRDGRPELYGKLVLMYTCQNSVISQGMFIEFTPERFNIGAMPVAIHYSGEKNEPAQSLQDKYRSGGTFSGCLFAHCLDRISYCFAKQSKDTDFTKDVEEIAEQVANKNHSALNKLFLMRHVRSPSSFEHVSMTFFAYAKKNELQLTRLHPFVRFLSNAAGLLLAGRKIPLNWLHAAIFTGYFRKDLFPNINVASELYCCLFKDSAGSFLTFAESLPESRAWIKDAIMAYFREYRRKTKDPLAKCHLLNSSASIEKIFACLFFDNSAESAKELSALLLKESNDDPSFTTKHLVDILWFDLALKNKSEQLPLLMELYTAIDPKSIYIKEKKSLHYIAYTPQNAEGMCKYLEENMSVLVKTGGGCKKYARLLSLARKNILRRS